VRSYSLLLAVVLTAALCTAGCEEGGVAGVREVIIFNPLPSPYRGLVMLNVSFLDGEAFNDTLRVWGNGSQLPVQLLNCSYYPSGYYRSCRVMFPVAVPGMEAVRYRLTYYSAPLRVNFSWAGLRVSRENLTITGVNATGAYPLNLTNALVIKGPGYTAVFDNRTLIHLELEGLAGNMVFFDWPFAGFALLRGGRIIASGYDLSKCRVRLLLNGSLIASVEQVCEGGGARLRQIFTFSGLAPIIRVHSSLEPPGPGLLYYPLLRLPSSSEYVEVLVNGSEYKLVRARSYTPPPKWLALKGKSGWLVVLVNYTAPHMPDLIETLERELWSEYVQTTSPIAKARYRRLLRVMANVSRLLTAAARVKAGEANYTTLLSEARGLSTSLGDYEILLGNLTDMLEKPERLAHRLILVPSEEAVNVAYQVNGTPPTVNVTITLGRVPGDPASWVRTSLIQEAVGVAVLRAPLAAKLEAPHSALVDDFVSIRAVVESSSKVENVSVRLLYPHGLAKLVEGEDVVNFSSLEGTLELEWVLRAVYEGDWRVAVNVTCSAGSLRVEKTINVTLPPVVPRIVIPSSFNISITCVDLHGRPLGGYLVNLYENKSGTLVASALTNESGRVEFLNVSRGVYLVEVTDGLYRTTSTVCVFANRNLTVIVGRARLAVRVEMGDGSPLPLALVYVRDENGSLTCAGFTNSSGLLVCDGLPLGNYTVSVRWQGTIAGFSRVRLNSDKMVRLRGVVRRVTIFVTLAGKPAAGATVMIYSSPGVLVETLRTDERGSAIAYLLPGTYRFVAVKGQYSASSTVDVRTTRLVTLNLEVSSSLWLLTAATACLWLLTAYIWHRKTSYVYRERERYKRLLQRLEELYARGEIEDKYYFKLKQEYEEKLNELSRGEMV